jgi:hypothetical protein
MLLTSAALDDTFLGISELKRTRSLEPAEDNDDTFSFLNTEGNDHTPSLRQETPGTCVSF